MLRDRLCRHNNLALTAEGFAKARRLGGVPGSEIVDLDRVEANWREPGDFLLGWHLHEISRDDDIIREVHLGKRNPQPHRPAP